MELREIIATLMMSEIYFSLPLRERKAVVFRLRALYGRQNALAVPANPLLLPVPVSSLHLALPF